MSRPRTALAVLACTALLRAGGPPYLTDDPVPVAYRGLEGYVFSTYDRGPGGRFLLLPASEFNYGAVPNLQLHVQATFAWMTPNQGPTLSGWGDAEVGAKFRFLDEGEGHPQISFYPQIELPTGNAGRGLGNGKAWYKIPFWAQKSWGDWTLCGGGGRAFNPTRDALDYTFAGLQVERGWGERASLGAELYHQGAQALGERASTLLNVGGTLQVREGTSLLFSAGWSIRGERHTVAYLGLIHTWGARA